MGLAQLFEGRSSTALGLSVGFTRSSVCLLRAEGHRRCEPERTSTAVGGVDSEARRQHAICFPAEMAFMSRGLLQGSQRRLAGFAVWRFDLCPLLTALVHPDWKEYMLRGKRVGRAALWPAWGRIAGAGVSCRSSALSRNPLATC